MVVRTRKRFLFVICLALSVVIPLLIDEKPPRQVYENDVGFRHYALNESERFTSGSLELNLAQRVISLKGSPDMMKLDGVKFCGRWEADPFSGIIPVEGIWEATVQLYTFFGIPYSRLHVTCDSVARINDL